MPPSIFNIPDVQERLASFLSPDDLYRCSHVCRSWHHAFFRHAWQTLILKTARRKVAYYGHPAHAVLRRLGTSVQALHVHEHAHLSVFIEHFKTLRELYFNLAPKSYMPEVPMVAQHIVRANARTLRVIHLVSRPGFYWADGPLEIRGRDLLSSIQTECIGLEQLILGFQASYRVQIPVSLVVSILRQCRRLTHLHIYRNLLGYGELSVYGKDGLPDPFQEERQEDLNEFPNLRSLVFQGMDTGNLDTLRFFLAVWKRSPQISDFLIPLPSLSAGRDLFDNITKIIHACCRRKTPSSSSPSSLPNESGISLDSSRLFQLCMESHDLSLWPMTQLFDAVPTNKLRSLKINGGCYIDHSWKLEMVVQHAVSLVSIELNDMEFTSRTDDKLGIEHLWVYQVLTSCPNLKRLSATPCSWVASKFKMNHLWVEDLLAPWTPQQPQGWVCRGLEEFQVPILGVCRSQEDHYPKEGDCGVEPSGPSQHEACVSLQRRLFLELGKLRRLRVFSLGFERLQSDDIQSMGFPDFAYESGHLQELRSWKQLETFDVAYTHQDLSLSDIDWMVEHWPSLRVVKGLDIQPPRDHSLPREGLEEDIRNKYPSLVVE